jgi:hypothetical protein
VLVECDVEVWQKKEMEKSRSVDREDTERATTSSLQCDVVMSQNKCATARHTTAYSCYILHISSLHRACK